MLEPIEPVIEEESEPFGLVLFLADRRDHGFGEPVGRALQHFDLKRLLRLEMREELALRHAEALRKRPERNRGDPALACDGDRLVEDADARPLALGGVGERISRPSSVWRVWPFFSAFTIMAL